MYVNLCLVQTGHRDECQVRVVDNAEVWVVELEAGRYDCVDAPSGQVDDSHLSDHLMSNPKNRAVCRNHHVAGEDVREARYGVDERP